MSAERTALDELNLSFAPPQQPADLPPPPPSQQLASDLFFAPMAASSSAASDVLFGVSSASAPAPTSLESRAEDISALICALRAASAQHASMLAHKTAAEREAQGLYASLWAFPTEQRSAGALCGCDTRVNFAYATRVASLSGSARAALAARLGMLAKHNARQVFLSLYEQTAAEIALRRAVHRTLRAADATGSGDGKRMLFEALAEAVAPSQQQQHLSEHSAGVVRKLATLVGAAMISGATQQQQQTTATAQLIALDDAAVASPPKPQQTVADCRREIARMLAKHGGLAWGAALVQPDVSDIVSGLWSLKETLFSAEDNLSEPQRVAVLAQLPWERFGELTTEQADTLLVGPLTESLGMALQGLQHKLAVAVAAFFMHISHAFPALAMKALAAVTRALWPSKMLCAPLFPLFAFHALGQQELLLVFGELYHLFTASAADYAVQHPAQRVTHRNAYGVYLLSHFRAHAPAFDTSAGPSTRLRRFYKTKEDEPLFPHFFAFAEIALCWIRKAGMTQPHAPVFDLANLVLDELYFFAFVFMAQTSDPNSLARLHAEAAAAISVIATERPEMLNRVVASLGFHTHDTQHNLLSEFFLDKRTNTRRFVPDPSAIEWLAFLVAHLPPPLMAPPQPIHSHEFFVAAIKRFLFTAPTARMTNQASAGCVTVGCKLLEVIDWSKLPAIGRLQVVMLLLAARRLVSKEWFVAFLLRRPGAKLFAGPFDVQFARMILSVAPSTFSNPDDLIMAQAMLLIALANQHYSDPANAETAENTTAWLGASGLFRHLSYLTSKNEWDFVAGTLVRLWESFRIDKDPHCAELIESLVFEFVRTHDHGRIRLLVKAMSKTVTQPTSEASLLAADAWVRILTRRSQEDTGFMHLLDVLLGFMIAENLPISSVSSFAAQVLKGVRGQFLPKSSHGRIYRWLALSVALHMQPMFPQSSATTEKTLKGTGIAAIMDLALALKDPIEQLQIWEHFFVAYFKALDSRIDAVTLSQKADLNKQFSALAQQIDESSPLRLFCSTLTTWNREQILEGSPSRFPQAIAAEIKKQRPPIMDRYRHSPTEDGAQIESSIYSEFLRMQDEERREMLLQVAPARASLPTELDVRESEQLESSVHATVQGFAVLSRPIDATNGSPEGSNVAAVRTLNELLDRYGTLQHTLQRTDEDFLELSCKLYVNTPKPFTTTAVCQRGSACLAPAVITGSSVAIETSSPTIKGELQENRERFGKDFTDLFNTSRSLAYVVAMLKSAKEALVQQQQQALPLRHMFFALLRPVVLRKPPPHSPVMTDLIQILSDLGRACVSEDPTAQMALHSEFMRITRDPKPQQASAQKLSSQAVGVKPKSDVPPAPVQPLIAVVPSTSPLSAEPPKSAQPPASSLSAQPKQPRFFTESYRTLFALSNPQIFLAQSSADSRFRFVEQLREILSARSPNWLLPEDEASLVATYKVGECFTALSEDGDLLGAIAKMIPEMTAKPSFSDFVASFLPRMLALRFPENMPFVLDALLSSDSVLKIAESAFARLDLTQFTPEQAMQLQGMLAEKLPAPEPARKTIISAARPVISSPSFHRNPSAASELMAFAERALAEYHGTERPSHASVEATVALFQAFASVDSAYSAGLLNVCLGSLLPLFASHKLDPAPLGALMRQASADTWRGINADTLNGMADALFQDTLAAEVVVAAFEKVEWDTFIRAASFSEELLLPLLRLIAALLIAKPGCLSQKETLRQWLCMPGAEPGAGSADWSKLNGSAFASAFGGNAFVSLLKTVVPRLTEAPTKGLLEALRWISSIVSRIPAPLNCTAAHALSAEAFRVAFLVLKDESTGLSWAMPDSDITHILLDVVLSAVRVVASVPAECAFSRVVQHALSFCSPQASVVPLPKVSFAAIQGAVTLAQNKLRGLVFQFARQSEPATALEVISQAARSVPSTNVCVQLVEEALHSFFSSAEPGSGSTETAAGALALPPCSTEDLADACVAERTALTLYVTVAKLRVAGSAQPLFSALASRAYRFSPHVNYEFDSIAVWFALIDAVNDEKWVAATKDEEALLQALHWLLDLAGGSTSTSRLGSLLSRSARVFTSPGVATRIQLACRACHLMLLRLFVEKYSGDIHDTSSLVDATLTPSPATPEEVVASASRPMLEMKRQEQELALAREQLLSMRDDPQYHAHASFFDVAESFTSPLCSVDAFKRDVARTLFPSAPYLQNL